MNGKANVIWMAIFMVGQLLQAAAQDQLNIAPLESRLQQSWEWSEAHCPKAEPALHTAQCIPEGDFCYMDRQCCSGDCYAWECK